MAVVTMKQLLDSGTHFGHQTRRWNPKMKRFIFTDRNGIYIIDLQQTLTFIDKAYEFVKETVAHGGSVLFVGTKKQAQESIAAEATRVGMPYVNQRWLGGMLTNFSTVHKRLQRLKELEAMEQTGGFEGRTKKEILMLTREKNKLDRSLGGIRDMAKVPSAVWVVDTNKEHIAVGEARKLGIPVIAILDTNCDPDLVDYPIPGNDDAIRSVALLTRVVADAVADGLISRAGAAETERLYAKAMQLQVELSRGADFKAYANQYSDDKASPDGKVWATMANTYQEAITDTASGVTPRWRILWPPTGSGKTLGAKVYAALQAEQNAASVGLLTTRSVVESVFLVIVLDAAFSIMFSVLGI